MEKSEVEKHLSALGVGLLAVYSVFSLIVLSHILEPVDIGLFRSINAGFSVPFLDGVMILLTLYGRELTWVSITVLLFFLGGKEGKNTSLTLVFLFALLIVVGYSLKIVEFRPRPYDVLSEVRLLVPPEVDSSFPSGHALLVSGGATVTWLRMKKRWAVPIAVDSFLVAYSRIYVGVHFPLDVLGGSVLGIAVACLVVGQQDRLAAIIRETIKRKPPEVG